MLAYYFFPALYTVCMIVLVVLYLQSGFDKVFNFKDNFDWLQGHFSKSILKGIVKPMLLTITIFELSTGFCGILAIADIWIIHQWYTPFIACFLSMLSLTCLFAGQRLAKDYAGAATLIGYMAYTLLMFFFTAGLMLFAEPHFKIPFSAH